MKILITGGAGFVGSSLALHLKSKYPRAKLVCLDNLSRKGSKYNVPRLKRCGIVFKRGDVENMKDIESCGGFDLVLDCAADPSVLSGIRTSAEDLIRTNFLGTINTLKATSACRADFIFLSTSRVFPIELLNMIKTTRTKDRLVIAPRQTVPGVSQRGINEHFPVTGASRSFYGSSKLASELFIEEYGAFGHIGKYVINRCSVIAGPWQMGKVDQGVLTLWVARHHFGWPVNYIGWGGEGKQVRDFLHIDDLCELVSDQMSRMNVFHGQIFHVGGGLSNSASLRELTDLCREETQRRVAIRPVIANRQADIKLYITDNGKIERTSGWKPRRNLRQIVRDTALWIRKNEKLLQPIFTP